LGPETFFLGQIHGGDFYNRVPTRAYLNGTYRCWPDKTWQDVEHVFADLLASVDAPPELEVALALQSNGLGYALEPEAPVVRALRSAYERVVGRELPLVGAQSVCDVNIIVREAGIPAVAHGTGTTTAHADLEWVEIDNVVRSTKVYLTTIVHYLGVKDDRTQT
jgi:acetylornithine deacetylase